MCSRLHFLKFFKRIIEDCEGKLNFKIYRRKWLLNNIRMRSADMIVVQDKIFKVASNNNKKNLTAASKIIIVVCQMSIPEEFVLANDSPFISVFKTFPDVNSVVPTQSYLSFAEQWIN